MSIPAASYSPSRAGTPPGYEMQDERKRTLIEASHQRSQSFGIATSDQPDFSPSARAVLAQTMEENRFLLLHAAPAMETLYEQIANTHSMVLLTSAKSVVLHSLGDMTFWRMPRRWR